METIELIKAEIDKLGNGIDAKIAKVLAEEGQKMHSDTKTELQNMVQKQNELSEKLTATIEKEKTSLQNQFDELQTKVNKGISFNEGQNERFAEVLQKNLDGVKQKLINRKSGGGLDFTLKFAESEIPGESDVILTKAVGDMTTATNVTALSATGYGVIAPNSRPGVLTSPLFPYQHVRDFITTYPTQSPIIHYVRENGGEGEPGMVAEGALKPQIDFDLTDASSPVRKIAAVIRLTEEMIEDVPYITNYVTVRGAEKLRRVEDYQILYGDGTGQNLRGLTLDAATFTAGTMRVTEAQNVDVIRAAMVQLRVGYYGATAVMLNPFDVFTMETTKDADNNYMFRNADQNGLRTVWGLPIIENDSITAGSFFLGDFRNGAELFDRKALNIRFYDQDRDNAVTNKVTIVIEERLALANIRPAAFVKGTFAAATTALKAAVV